jgi:fatty-acyl-CoA synthase
MKQSHGRPMSGEIRIIDSESGNECPARAAGEICVRGPALFGGYFGMPDETAQCMDDDGFFHSGDVGWVDEDGYVYYLGRFKEMIKTGGENVSAAEIEAFLTAAVPAIRRVIVCGTPHDKWGEAVTALIESEPETELGERDVIDACRGQLAGYKIPKRITFVHPSDWVITPTGKLDRRVAQRIALDRFAAIDHIS